MSDITSKSYRLIPFIHSTIHSFTNTTNQHSLSPASQSIGLDPSLQPHHVPTVRMCVYVVRTLIEKFLPRTTDSVSTHTCSELTAQSTFALMLRSTQYVTI